MERSAPERPDRGTAEAELGRRRAGAGWILPLLILAVALAGLAGCRPGGSRSRPAVIFILVDAWRADFAGVYGQPGQMTPHFDRLARRGTLFRRVVTGYTVTHLSCTSMLASRWYPVLPQRQFQPMLPLMLATRGYRTACFHRNPLLKGLGPRWSGQFQTSFVAKDYTWKTIRPHLWPYLAENAGQPFLAYVHYMDVHDPYQPRPPLERLYPSPGVAYDPANGPRLDRTPESLASGRALSMASVRDWDMHLGDLVNHLQQLGLLDTALIVITADHGEEFGEHGFVGHGHAVHQETAEVPLLLVYRPEVPAGRIVDGLVRSIDLVPTILELLGQEPPADLQGVSIAAAVAGGAPVPPLEAYTQGREFGWPRARRTDEWTLIEARPGEAQLFAAAADPGERVDLAATHPAIRGPAASALATWYDEEIPVAAGSGGADAAPRKPVLLEKVDGQDLEELKALGYAN